MSIESIGLPQAALNHSKALGVGKTLPANAAAKASEAIASERSTAESFAVTTGADTEKAAKNAPRGLENAISRLESKEKSNSGIEQALAMLNRNLARYQVTQPESGSEASDGATAETADASAAAPV